jgi:phospholipase/lecithinase/hemolysin
MDFYPKNSAMLINHISINNFRRGKMNTKVKRMFLIWFLSIFLILSTVVGSYAYNSILSFGDSLSDNGIYQLYPGGTVGNTNPADIYGFYRFSNGPVWVEYLAQNLSVPLLDMAYGGATTSWGNPAAYSLTSDPYYLSNTGLQWQVAAYAANPSLGTIPDDTLVTVWAGGDDMFNYNPIVDPVTYSPLYAAENIAIAIQTLIALGGDSFLIPNLPITTPWVTAFDPYLAAAVAGLRLLNPGVNFYELDLRAFVPTGIDYYDGTYLAQTYDEPGVYAWWDQVGVHPTTEVHVQIAAYATPEPSSIILLICGLTGLIGLRRKFIK